MEIYSELNSQNKIIISTIKAQRLIEKRCVVFLTNMVQDKSTKVTISDVLVVKEFPNVFLDELTLSLKREVESKYYLALNSKQRQPIKCHL
jgi:hypothetical protein